MKILVINSGSSSIKYQLFNTGPFSSICKGLIERIGSKDSILTHSGKEKRPVIIETKAPDHGRAVKKIFSVLIDPAVGAVDSYRHISGIGHRVVHGSDLFTKPTLIDDKVIRSIEGFNALAPLHNPPAILSIRACRKAARGVPQVAVFDTAFHQTMPPAAYVYGIPYEFYQKMKIRRYGFHGTSHKFVARQAAIRMGKNLRGLKIITCHLGNGCSIAAVKNGVSIDTSMGFTPLEGLLMGTRCGDIDPAVILYIMQKKRSGIRRMSSLLNKESGLLGLSKISNDMRDIIRAAKAGRHRARLALDIFTYRIKKYIGAYTAAMDGLDAVVLTAGIGENAPVIKSRIERQLKAFLNSCRAKVMVIPTDEEAMIAHETREVISKLRRRQQP